MTTRERQCAAWGLGFETQRAPDAVDQEQRGDLSDPLLDDAESDELGVEAFEHVVDLGVADGPLDFDDLVVGDLLERVVEVGETLMTSTRP